MIDTLQDAVVTARRAGEVRAIAVTESVERELRELTLPAYQETPLRFMGIPIIVAPEVPEGKVRVIVE